MRSRYLLVLSCLLSVSPRIHAQAPVLPPGDKEPVLRLEAGGPTGFVTALAFSPNGKVLYAVGWDKVVRVWNLEKGQFVLDRTAYRVPIGPGLDGALNTLAVSPDGQWLAVGGMGVIRGGAGFRQDGVVLKRIGAMTPQMREDEGMISVFDVKTREVRLLRGHRGPVVALAFAPPRKGKPTLLVSAAREWDDNANAFKGVVRLWDVTRRVQLDERTDLSKENDRRPGLAIWHTGDEPRQVAVAIAWEEGDLLLWEADPAINKLSKTGDGRYNNTVVSLPQPGRLLTCSFRQASGHLQSWQWVPGQDPRADAQRKVSFPPADKVYFFPRALGLLSSKVDGAADLAAVVLRLPDRGEEYRLDLIDVQPGSFGAVKASIKLWQGTISYPALATAPGGSHLAVAGDAGHEIRVYAVAHLLANRVEPQILRSTGETLRHVMFVTRDRDRGLALNETAEPSTTKPRPPQAGDLIFDFTRRALTTNLKEWQLDTPALAGWQVRHTKDKDGARPCMSVRAPNQRVPSLYQRNNV